MNHGMVTVVVNRFQNEVSFDCITVARKAIISRLGMKVKCHEDVPPKADGTQKGYVVKRIVRRRDENEAAQY